MSGRGALAGRRSLFDGPLVPVLLGVLAFLPALRIGFFRDDYGWVSGAILARGDWGWLLEPAKTDFRPMAKLSVLFDLFVFGILSLIHI